MGTPWFRSLHVIECKVTLSPSLWSLEWLHRSSSRVSELLALHLRFVIALAQVLLQTILVWEKILSVSASPLAT